MSLNTLGDYINKARKKNASTLALKPAESKTNFASLPKLDNAPIKDSNNQSMPDSNRQNTINAKPKKLSPKSKIEESFDPDVLVEEFPTNAMGDSSSTSGTGPIDTYDPLLKIGKNIFRRKKIRNVPSIPEVKGI